MVIEGLFKSVLSRGRFPCINLVFPSQVARLIEQARVDTESKAIQN